MKHEETTLNTKNALAAALKSAMGKKPLSKITVSEIVTACGVNRKTFYYHFADIYALLTWMLDREAVEVVKQFDLITDPEDAIDFVVQYAESNRHILNCALDSVGREQLKHFFFADITGLVQSAITGKQAELGVTISAEYLQFLTTFWSEALVGLLIDWLQKKNLPERGSARSLLGTAIRAGLPAMLQAGAKG